MLRKAVAVGFLAGFVFAFARCGPTQVLPGPTSLLIRVSAGGFAAPIYSYLFTGTKGGFGAFADTQRPVAAEATAPLSGPQTFRIIFPDSYAPEAIEVTVFALDVSGDIIGFGKGSKALELGKDVTLEVGVQPPLGAADSGIDAGGGGYDAGPSRACACDGGCCGADGGCQPPVPFPFGYTFQLAACGPNGMTCNRLCDPGKSSVCINDTCRCGASAACNGGEFCLADPNGNFRCVCDNTTACQGCCTNGTTCRAGESDDACGRAGFGCLSCIDAGVPTVGRTCRPASAAVPKQWGVCTSNVLGCSDPTTCATGPVCTKFSFPTCRAPAGANTCFFCDWTRSNKCDGIDTSGCSCGSVGLCNSSQYCAVSDGGAVSCRTIGT